MRSILFGAVALCALFPAIAWSTEAKDEESITMNDVPVQVRASAQAAANGTKLDKVGLDLDDGTATYEFSGKNADGKMIEVDVSHEGRIEEFELEISMDSVPEAVKMMLTKHLPKFKAEKAEKSTRENFEVYYEFDGQGDDGQELDVEVRSDGKRIIIQDDAAA